MIIEKGKPLQLPDGTIILPEPDSSGSKVISKDEQEEQAAQEAIMGELSEVLDDPISEGELYKRTLADVTVPFQRMNTTMLVVSLTLWGLDGYAIGRMLNADERSIESIKNTDLFSQLQRELVEAVRFAETSSVHGYLAAKAHAAAKVVASTLVSKNGDLKLAAAKDILDRAGFRPVDRVEHKHTFEDELRFRFIREEETKEINVEYEVR